MTIDVSYVPCDPPRDLGWQNSSSGWFRTCVFGYYRVRLDDGWTFMSPHSGSPGTVGAWPIDLNMNPEFRTDLIDAAKACRLVES